MCCKHTSPKKIDAIREALKDPELTATEREFEARRRY